MKKLIHRLYVYTFGSNLDFARGLFVVYLLAQKLTMTEVGILQTLLFWSNLASEVPAGILADSTKRKYSLAIGSLIIALAAGIMIFANNFWIAAIAFVLHGMGFAFRSGADQALLYDELKNAGPEWENQFVVCTSRVRALTNISLVAAIAIGGLLQPFGWQWVYGIFSVAMLISAISALLIPETHHRNPAETEVTTEEGSRNSVFSTLKTYLSGMQGRDILLFILGMGFLEATHAPFFIYIQPYLKSEGLTDSSIAWVVSLSMILTSLGYRYVDRLKAISFRKLVVGMNLVLGLLLIIFLMAPPLVLGIALFAVIDLLPALLFVHTDQFINEKISSEIRASMLSVHSFVSSVFISIAFLIGGAALDAYRPEHFLGALCVLPLLGAYFMSRYFRRQLAVPPPSAEVVCS